MITMVIITTAIIIIIIMKIMIMFPGSQGALQHLRNLRSNPKTLR